MKKDQITLTVFVVLAVGLLSLVLMLMKSPVWALGFPIVFASLGLLCYGIEGWIAQLKKTTKLN